MLWCDRNGSKKTACFALLQVPVPYLCSSELQDRACKLFSAFQNSCTKLYHAFPDQRVCLYLSNYGIRFASIHFSKHYYFDNGYSIYCKFLLSNLYLVLDCLLSGATHSKIRKASAQIRETNKPINKIDVFYKQ
jgi:hypothetical protein